MYDAIRTGRELIRTLVETDLPPILAQVAIETGVQLDDVRAVYFAPTGSAVFPCVDVRPPDGELEVYKSSIGSELFFNVILTAAGADVVSLDERLSGYLTALVRLLSLEEGESYSLDVVALDTSPVVTRADSTQVQSVGVRVRFRTVEER